MGLTDLVIPSWAKYLAAAIAIGVSIWFYNHWLIAIGENNQKVADQAIFDQYNKAISDLHTKAMNELQSANKQAMDRKLASDKITKQLEVARETDKQKTEQLRRYADAYSLRFAASNSAGGEGGNNAETNQGGTTNNTGTATCELSAEASRSIKSLVYDADTLRDDYRLLYDWVRSVECY